jgi:hypothetical protein
MRINGNFCAYLKDTPEVILWEKHNVETIFGGWLLSWVMASSSLRAQSGVNPVLFPQFPIWGLALGTATADQLPTDDNVRKVTRTLKNEIFRKNSSYLYFLNAAAYLASDSQKLPQDAVSPYLEVQTIFNTNTDTVLDRDGITITEMGLVGGTIDTFTDPAQWATDQGASMGGAPVTTRNGGILLDYVNPEPFQIPRGRDFIISTVLDFSH